MRSKVLTLLCILFLLQGCLGQLGQAPEVNSNSNEIPIVDFSVKLNSLIMTFNPSNDHPSLTVMPVQSHGVTSMGQSRYAKQGYFVFSSIKPIYHQEDLVSFTICFRLQLYYQRPRSHLFTYAFE